MEAERQEGAPGEMRQPPRHGWRPFAAGFALFLLLGVASAALRNDPLLAGPVVQPIAFNHLKHVTGNGIECTTCHAFYETEAFSGLPDAETCAACHAEAQGKSEEEGKLVRLLASGGQLEWKSLFRQPAHVFYSHRRHVVAARIECKVCHGAIAESTTPPGRVARLRMDGCLECHRRQGASQACTSCHR